MTLSNYSWIVLLPSNVSIMELEHCERYIHRAKVSKALPVDEFFVAAGGARLGFTTV